MTTKRTKPAADEAACPVAPLAREFARILRARRKLDDETQASDLLKCTDLGEDADPVGPLSREYADKLLQKRRGVVQSTARQLHATSKIGAAFQLLLSHNDFLQSHALLADWNAAPPALRDLSERLDDERSAMIWSAYKLMTAGWDDPDLPDLERILGRESLTDAECIERILAAVA